MCVPVPRLPRASGVLVHPTSLPGPYGVGDLGASARTILDFLARAGQHLWQVLPLTPTGYGDSPYAAPSAFAGNTLLVALEPLLDLGLLHTSDVHDLTSLPAERVDYARLVPLKRMALQCAFERFTRDGDPSMHERFSAFRHAEAEWLDDFALFAALRERLGTTWTEWDPPLRDREPDALQAAHDRLADAVEGHAFAQFLFFDQWAALRSYAQEQGIRIVGDIPIFVALDSADVWAHPDLFKLDENRQPTVVAGVPPDYFSKTGQLWGNPLYDWDALAVQGYLWWVRRFQHLLRMVDVVRIDHFRGFEAAWEVPAGAETAEHGQWVAGPGARLFRAIEASMGGPAPIIAEDLGLITPEVQALLAELGYPGMKVLQFAFGGQPDNSYLPHTYADPNCVVYTGTHDNDTTRGWFASAPEPERDLVRRYLGTSGADIAWDFIRLALASVADAAIIPLQDVLDLGSEARMNLPGAAHDNWQWRATAQQLQPAIAERLHELTWLYARTDPRA
jgi:4-alpha-glucanotransferase